MSLRSEQDGRIRRITLASPATKNRLDAELASKLLSALRDSFSDPATGVVLLEAEGPVFCAGYDLLRPPTADVFRFAEEANKPVVISVAGSVFSAGVHWWRTRMSFSQRRARISG